MPRDTYDNWTKDQLIEQIQQLEKQKKFGLVWDKENTLEKFEVELESSLPVLVEDHNLAIKNDVHKPTHVLIEGDNYHALSVLNYTHEESVDVIYIDPPYNTGSTSWKYNNKFIDKEDTFKHSKWLSFMQKRLVLSKKLLNKSGIIVVAIDDYEHHTLRLLMDELFGESNRLGTIVVVHNPRGRNDDKYFATYAIFSSSSS